MFNILLIAGASSTLANGLSTTGALLLNFLINRSVFSRRPGRRSHSLRAAKRFAVVAVLSALFVFFGFEIGVSMFSLESAFQQSGLRVLLILGGSGLRFVLYGTWVFKEES